MRAFSDGVEAGRAKQHCDPWLWLYTEWNINGLHQMPNRGEETGRGIDRPLTDRQMK